VSEWVSDIPTAMRSASSAQTYRPCAIAVVFWVTRSLVLEKKLGRAIGDWHRWIA
jgi:hypothetical protein